MNIKKYLVGAGLTAAVLTGVASMVLAHNLDNPQQNSTSHDHLAMIVQVNQNGRALLRGTIKSVGTNSLVVTSWGGDWTINTSSTTRILPESSMSGWKAGDFVGIHGSVRENAVMTIDVTLVRDWSARKEIKELKDAVNPRNWQGVVSNMNAASSTMTLTVDGTAYTVNIVAGAKIVNKNYVPITLANISNGDSVRVWAIRSGTTLTAYIVRDTSIQ